jgi:hypothetical protein
MLLGCTKLDLLSAAFRIIFFRICTEKLMFIIIIIIIIIVILNFMLILLTLFWCTCTHDVIELYVRGTKNTRLGIDLR